MDLGLKEMPGSLENLGKAALVHCISVKNNFFFTYCFLLILVYLPLLFFVYVKRRRKRVLAQALYLRYFELGLKRLRALYFF